MRRLTVSLAVITMLGLAVPALAAGGQAAAATRHPAAAAAVQEHLTLVSKSATAATGTVRARGVLTTTGKTVRGEATGARANIWLVFKRGSVKLVTTRTTSSATVPDPSTCKFLETFTGTYQVGGGARKYTGATGSGRFISKIYGRLDREDGRCTAGLASFWQGTWTSGSLHL